MSHDPETFSPIVVCLCGSTRFKAEFEAANERETLAGRIVLTVGYWRRVGPDGGRPDVEESVKRGLDELHLQKINLADEVLAINVGLYVGTSTKRELWYARRTAKKIRFLEPLRDDHGDELSEADVNYLVDGWFTDWDAWRAAGVVAAAVPA